MGISITSKSRFVKYFSDTIAGAVFLYEIGYRFPGAEDVNRYTNVQKISEPNI